VNPFARLTLFFIVPYLNIFDVINWGIRNRFVSDYAFLFSFRPWTETQFHPSRNGIWSLPWITADFRLDIISLLYVSKSG